MPERIGRRVARAADAVCIGLFAAVFLVFVWKIAMRYLAHVAVAWADEVSVVLFIWIIFIANGFLVEDRRQIFTQNSQHRQLEAPHKRDRNNQ